jgi:ketosteroid isomerase-like protein
MTKEETQGIISIRNLVLLFFDAENRRDWVKYTKFLAPDVEWTSYEYPRRRIVRGREEYLKAIKRAYAGRHSTFEIETFVVDEKKGLAVAELSFEGRRSVDVFELRGGLICREREYFDDSYWLRHISGA